MALMVTDISNYKMGYLTREQLDMQYQYARANEFNERKYNQIAHLIGYLKYDKNEGRFWFANDPQIADKNFDEKFVRDGVKHRIYKEELKEESKMIYGEPVCYLNEKHNKNLIIR